MNGFYHLVTGVSTGLLVSKALNTNPVTTICICTVGSIIVDIDENSSTINKILFPVPQKIRPVIKVLLGALLIILSLVIPIIQSSAKGLMFIGILLILSVCCSRLALRFDLFNGINVREYHRTIFHSPVSGLFIFFLPLFLLQVNYLYILDFTLGVTTHIIADSFTHYGVPLFPFRGRFRMPIHFKSGNRIAESIICFSYAAFALSYSSNLLNVLSKFK